MGEIIFVDLFDDEGKYYQSYKEEFWTLVKLSGFHTCKLGEIDYGSKNTYICFLRNGDIHANFNNRSRNCKIILWFLEWSKWENGLMELGYLEDGRGEGFSLEKYWDEVWVSDRYYKRLLEQENDTKIKYVFFGGHPSFGGETRDERWDFAPLAYNYGTRAHKMEILAVNGYSFAPMPKNDDGSDKGWWGEDKEIALRHSRWGLCLHQFNTAFLNSQRLTLFASWGLPIISDYCVDPYPYEIFPEGLIHFDPRNTICGDRQIMHEAAEHNRYLVTHYDFKKCVENAVEGIEIKIV